MIGGDNQYPCVTWLVNRVLSDQDTRLNRFAQSNFIGKQVSFDRISENTSDDCDLMLKQLNSRRSKTSKTSKRRALCTEVTNDPGSPIKKEGRIGDARCQVVGRVLDGMGPTRVQLRNGHACLLSIGEPDVIVVFACMESLGLYQATVNPSGQPIMPNGIEPKDASLWRQFDRADRLDRNAYALKRGANRRLEVFDFCPGLVEFN